MYVVLIVDICIVGGGDWVGVGVCIKMMYILYFVDICVFCLLR